MSVIPKESVKIVAESVGVVNLSDEIASSMAPDLEYRIREIAQVHYVPFAIIFHREEKIKDPKRINTCNRKQSSL